jgi:hypothetical protein
MHSAEEFNRTTLNSASRSPHSSQSSKSSTHSSPPSNNVRDFTVHPRARVFEAELLVQLKFKPIDVKLKADMDFMMTLRHDVYRALEQFGAVRAFQFVSIANGIVNIRLEMDSVLAGDKAVKFLTNNQFYVIHKVLPAKDVLVEMNVVHWDPRQCPDNWVSEFAVQGVNTKDTNRVIFEKIVSGSDVRTSVMLRDLPNRMSYFEIIRLLNWICPGRYVFSYLRIDFENQHNVGYVFIDFRKAKDILVFMERIVGHRWQIYNSEKVAQLSYANIQGRECLIERFRNSAVVGQWPCFRPKLWISLNDPDFDPFHPAKEEKFPQVTNQTKYNRSKDNQVAVGLYPAGHRAPSSMPPPMPPSSTHMVPHDPRQLIRNDGVNNLFDHSAAFGAITEVELPYAPNYSWADAPPFVPICQGPNTRHLG